jgi:hypothetical protein
MTKPNTQFTLTVKDIRIIEDALRNKVGRRSERIWKGEDPEILQTEMKEINDLLGRLHQQKNWYRPKEPYISG